MAETKACPYCSETIALEAKKCRYCNEWLDAFAGKLRFDAKTVTFPVDARLPLGRCWICGRSESPMAPKLKSYTYTPSGMTLAFGIIGQLLTQQSAKVALPLCRACKKNWILAEVAMWSGALLGFIVIPALCMLVGSAIARDDGMIAGMFVGFALWIGGVIAVKLLVVSRKQISCTLIDQGLVTLKVPDVKTVREALETEA